jgi:septum formation protein
VIGDPARPRLVLASTSPQRHDILQQLRIPFESVAPAYIEHDPPDADPAALVRAHAIGKARSVHRPGQATIGVDTTVHLDGRVYGKPHDVDDAIAMLQELSGRTHAVLSGLCLIAPDGETVEHATTLVTFRAVGERAIRDYVESGEWLGRAGGYAIQGLGGRLVERIDGDYSNVVGLPAALLVATLERELPHVLR